MLECNLVFSEPVELPACKSTFSERATESGLTWGQVADARDAVDALVCDGVVFCANRPRCDMSGCASLGLRGLSSPYRSME